MSLRFGSRNIELLGYTYAYMVGDVDTKKFIYGYLITFSRGAISRQST